MRHLFSLIFFLVPVLVFSADGDARADLIRIRSFIHRKEIIHIQSDMVWFTHVDGEVPGNWGGFEWPTYINNVPWVPTWEKTPNSDIFRIKNPYVALPMTKFQADTISVFLLEPDDVYATVIQYPDDWNNWQLTIFVDNGTSKRSRWIELEVAWDEWFNFRRRHVLETKTPSHIEPIVPTTVPSPTPVGRR